MTRKIVTLMLFIVSVLFAQTESAYGPVSGDTDFGGLLDPSRLSVSHSMSFYAGSSSFSNTSDVQSQSVYSTLLQYKFNAPVVLSLNFDMPLHSTFNQHGNFTSDNLQSFDYFRNMPIDAAITWMPRDNFALGVRVMRQSMPQGYYFGHYRHNRFNLQDRTFYGW